MSTTKTKRRRARQKRKRYRARLGPRWVEYELSWQETHGLSSFFATGSSGGRVVMTVEKMPDLYGAQGTPFWYLRPASTLLGQAAWLPVAPVVRACSRSLDSIRQDAQKVWAVILARSPDLYTQLSAADKARALMMSHAYEDEF